MSKVINRKNVVVGYGFGAGAEWTVGVLGIQGNFDEMIVKQITYNSNPDPANKQQGVFLIWSNQLRSYLGSFFDSCSISSDIRFLTKNITQYTDCGFRIDDAATGAKSTISTGELAIHLEFVEYAK